MILSELLQGRISNIVTLISTKVKNIIGEWFMSCSCDHVI